MEMETAYRRTVNCVFHLSHEERHRLFERLSEEYISVGWFQCCDTCHTKHLPWIEETGYRACMRWEECRRWRCERCLTNNNKIGLYDYMCDHHNNVTLRRTAFMCIKYSSDTSSLLRYHQVTDDVFRLTNEERHRLFERMAKGYMADLIDDSYFQCCDICNIKGTTWHETDEDFVECVGWKECRRWRCEGCITKTSTRITFYSYVCNHHSNVTLRDTALMSLRFSWVLEKP